nr:plasmid partitioning protein RepB C-terminal domain-containing protein [Burkholderia metallica]
MPTARVARRNSRTAGARIRTEGDRREDGPHAARGVSPERLAKALSVDVSQIIKRMALLDGICAEATELLKDRQFSPELARALRKMKPTRQSQATTP